MMSDILGVTDLAGGRSVYCGVGSDRTGRVLDEGSDREDRSSDVCDLGDIR